ncbi:MAG: hypothetical protein Q8922_05645 [Bacteroidota bacterium]|nr:hypothetical protein [Bacteroidota bacterium]MDP4233113.1 hypothetical protein [Bacteroidota bacterium]MDP4241742.1 hypothetical protein [Bacteroidota bacterium]MDP4287400.1 hypothetical protein [Bacteroidota bacterium]
MRPLLLFILLLFLTPTVQAQVWQQVFGPRGGSVRALAADAGHIYAGTDSGVFVSGNGGTTWDHDTIGLSTLAVYSLAVTQSGAVLAGTNGGGVFRSSDHGAHWASSSTGLFSAKKILSLAVDRHGNVFAGDSVQGVFLSTDDGQSWNSRSAQMPDSTTWSLMVTPSGMLYAGTTGYILFSTDLGDTWTPFSTPYGKIYGLMSDSSNGVYAGSDQNIIYETYAGSSSWRFAQPTGIGLIYRGMATDGQALYAASTGYGQGLGVFKSSNGIQWDQIGPGTDPSIYSLVATPYGDILAGSMHGYIFMLSGPPRSVSKSGSNGLSVSAYPNPFASNIRVHLTMSASRVLSLALYNQMGERVASLYDGWCPSGERTVEWTRSIPPGSYFLVMQSDSTRTVIPMECAK